LPFFPELQGTLAATRTLPFKDHFVDGSAMNEVPQLASAMLTVAFAAVMLVAAQLFIEYRSTPVVSAFDNARLTLAHERIATFSRR
jgi:hypothetical protein